MNRNVKQKVRRKCAEEARKISNHLGGFEELLRVPLGQLFASLLMHKLELQDLHRFFYVKEVIESIG